MLDEESNEECFASLSPLLPTYQESITTANSGPYASLNRPCRFRPPAIPGQWPIKLHLKLHDGIHVVPLTITSNDTIVEVLLLRGGRRGKIGTAALLSIGERGTLSPTLEVYCAVHFRTVDHGRIGRCGIIPSHPREEILQEKPGNKLSGKCISVPKSVRIRRGLLV